MNDYDRDIALAIERDGVRTQSGHHIGTPEAVEACPAMSHADRCAQIQEQEINKARISAYAENARRDAARYGPEPRAFWDTVDAEAWEGPDEDPWIDRRDNDR